MFELLVCKWWFYLLAYNRLRFTDDIKVGSLNRLLIGVRSPSHTGIMDVSTLLHNCFEGKRYTHCDLVPFLHNCSIYQDLSLKRSQYFQCVVQVDQEGLNYEYFVIMAASGRKYSLQGTWILTVAIGSVKGAKLV